MIDKDSIWEHNYVLGFLFNKDLSQVALIRKTKPEWQKGQLNGIGGKIEPGEDPLGAMIREFREETNYDYVDFEQFGSLYSEERIFIVHLFVGRSSQLNLEPYIESPTDEKPVIMKLPLMSENYLNNTPGLVYMAWAKLSDPEMCMVDVSYD